MAYDYKIHVKVDSREFIVHYDSDGIALRILERKMYGKYPIEGWYNACYWSAKSHVLGKGNTIPKRILATADQKIRNEQINFNATP